MLLTPVLPFLWVAVVDPCAAIGPATAAGTADRGQAAVYVVIGDEELRSGARDTAAAAYQKALRREPGNQRARAALARLCAEVHGVGQPTSDRFAEGLALLNAGRRREAVAVFEELRAAEHESAATLLEGICLFELHEDGPAEPLLREAAADPALAESARVFLGLLALRTDDPARAAEILRAVAVSDNPALRQTATEILRGAGRDGRAVASLLAETGYDSNVALTPDGSTSLPGSRDGSAGLAVTGSWRPLGRSGPFLRAAGQYRKQFQLSAFDLGGVGGALGWRHQAPSATGRAIAAGEYGYDFFTLGGAGYLSAHRLAAEAQLERERLLITVGALVRFESFLQDQTAGYSGTRIAGEAQAALRAVPDLLGGCGYRLAREGAREPSLSYWEHGPACHLWCGAGAGFRVLADAGLAFRRYQAPDPLSTDPGAMTNARRDTIIDGAVVTDWDAGPRWALRLTLTARKAVSNLGDYAYTRLTAMLGAIWTLALL